MGRARRGLWAGLAVALLLTGCQNKMYDQNRQLLQENQELRNQNQMLRQQQAVAPQQPVSPAVVPTTQNTVAETQIVPSNPAQGRDVEQIGGLETTVNPRTGNTIVHLPSDVFFDSGQATLKQSSKAVLDKVVSALSNKFGGKKIVINGHTDSQPIRVSKWESNQQLSEARAAAVKKYLVAKGIDADRITTRGYGDTRPRSTDMAKNRRVEIVVLTGQ